jgi:hypothetical protein
MMLFMIRFAHRRESVSQAIYVEQALCVMFANGSHTYVAVSVMK